MSLACDLPTFTATATLLGAQVAEAFKRPRNARECGDDSLNKNGRLKDSSHWEHKHGYFTRVMILYYSQLNTHLPYISWDLIFAAFADTTASAKIIQRKFPSPTSTRPYRASQPSPETRAKLYCHVTKLLYTYKVRTGN